MTVPVIDLFAGPGGLGEGFSRAMGGQFEIAVSIEKDPSAWQTLRLRAAHRNLQRTGAGAASWETWDRCVLDADWQDLFDRLGNSQDPLVNEACLSANDEAWCFELGPANRQTVRDRIRDRLLAFGRGGALPDNAVLIGGPPCQAYSHVGRARNRGIQGYSPRDDHRHFLYKEYLHVIAEFRPAVFVMENVKGILTSKIDDNWQIFHSIVHDLRHPGRAGGGDPDLEYVLVALSSGRNTRDDVLEPEDFIVRAEDYGIPQARHRVIICGVRRDVFSRVSASPRLERTLASTRVKQALAGLPRLRPQLSYRGKGQSWPTTLQSVLLQQALDELSHRQDPVSQSVAARMSQAIEEIRRADDPGVGADRWEWRNDGSEGLALLEGWYRDRITSVLANHQTKSHMPSDLVRYLFVSSFGQVTGQSPRLHDFPVSLLPEHRNVDPANPAASIFKDRFRVQIEDGPSTTVTSHIAKDGHAFIHPDPLQCRTLTVREAARLQTFSDSYVFLGSRTSQYTQVGNAVPPLLAFQMASAVASLLPGAFGVGDIRPQDAIA